MICNAVIINPDSGELSRCQEEIFFAGKGAYPYPCLAQEKHPEAPVYINCPANHQTWAIGEDAKEVAA